jgi:TolB protein
MIRRFALLLLALAATPAAAQLRVDITQGMSAPLPVAVPGFATPVPTATAAGNTAALGGQVASVIGNDLKSSGLFRPVGPTDAVAFAQTTAPAYETWRSAAAQALVTGAVTANADGTITIACYLYDPFAQQQLASEGFRVTPPAWRRAAHKCADKVYTRLTGEGGYFDSQIVYVAESGPKTHRRKQLAIMDQDGANHRFLTNGQSLVLTPRFAPNQGRVAYMSFAGNRPALWFYDAITGRTSIVGTFQGTSFSPRFSPDGRYLLMSLIRAGNANIYRLDLADKALDRLTDGASIDTSPSYSPDGSKIVFESDRGGTQQLYIMNADGGGAHRLSFGQGRYATPAWSPRGDLIAFTRIGGGKLRVGVMRPDGGGEHLLTDSFADEQPSWSPNGRVLVFFRTSPGGSPPQLMSADLTGLNLRRINTPLGASDPSWGPLRP